MIELPGAASPPATDELTKSGGRLAELVDPGLLLDVAERTADACDATVVAELHRLAGLDGRTRPRRGPFALRALAIAVADGRIAAHPDLRPALPRAVDQDPGDLGAKYRDFQQEAPIAVAAARRPHQSRWDVHHLWHAVNGMLWRPGVDRGDLYCGLRLNEASAEAHFYYFEEILAGRCERHAGVDPALLIARAPDCAECDAADQPMSKAETELRVREGLRFWDSELASIEMLRETGQLVKNPLDQTIGNWDDAFRYLLAHEPRLRSEPMVRWCERFLGDGQDRFASWPTYRTFVAARLVDLLLAPIRIDPAQAGITRARRILQDAGHRLLQAAHLGEVDEVAIEPIADAVATLHDATDAGAAAGIAWRALLAAARPGAERALALGYDLRRHLGPPADAPGDGLAGQLARDGLLLDPLDAALGRALPATVRFAGERFGPLELARRTAATSCFAAAREPVASPAASALADDAELADLARHEIALARRDDDDVRRREHLFALDPTATPLDDRTRVALNPTVVAERYGRDPRALAAGDAAEPREVVLWYGRLRGAPIVAESAELAELGESLRRPRPIVELTADDGPLAGRRALATQLLTTGLLVASR